MKPLKIWHRVGKLPLDFTIGQLIKYLFNNAATDMLKLPSSLMLNLIWIFFHGQKVGN